ncbi:hypothetical protein [Rugosimonospora africana]|nr:hypothetical protein [Rugosimonospora africana]
MTSEASGGPIIGITHFTIDPADSAEVKARHAAMVSALRATSPGPREACLGRIDEKTWAVIWRWDSIDHMRMTQETARNNPHVEAAFALTSGITGEALNVMDELPRVSEHE